MNYIGRFAPSPTGPLHLGSLVSALASWLDAKAHGGDWLIRIEDIDATRCKPQWSDFILRQLDACGLHSDGPIVFQSRRDSLYLQYLERLMPTRRLYLCHCSRLQIQQLQAQSQPTNTLLANLPSSLNPSVYPGTCRTRAPIQPSDYTDPRSASDDSLSPLLHTHGGANFLRFSQDHSVRITVGDPVIEWSDRLMGSQQQNLNLEVGDFVLKTKDNHFSYQWAVVVDDIDQGVSDVVRGADLVDNTPRQLFLYDLLQHARPRYLHVPLVLNENGDKLSKQTQALALNPAQASIDLNQAAEHLGLSSSDAPISERLQRWVQAWSQLHTRSCTSATKMA